MDRSRTTTLCVILLVVGCRLLLEWATDNPPLHGGWCLFCVLSILLPRQIAEPLLLGLRLRRPRWRADRRRLGRLYVQQRWTELTRC